MNEINRFSFFNEVIPSRDDDIETDNDKEDKACDNNCDKLENVKELGNENIPAIVSDIHLITIIGQVEGHSTLNPQNKATKYEHIIPQLVAVEESADIKGLLIILNTVGGDVECGLAIASAIDGLKKPTVALVLGGAHSIGAPIAVAARKTFIAKSASMTIHPVRMSGMVIGVHQTFEYFKKIQDRIITFVVEHSNISEEDFRALMLETGELASDIGTVVNGEEAVAIGLCDEVGTLSDALACLHTMIEEVDNTETSPEN